MIDVGKSDTAGTKVKAPSGPPLPSVFARYRDGVGEELRRTVPSPRQDPAPGDPPAALYRMLQYHMGWTDEEGGSLAAPVAQGKALRPTLCLLACEALCGDWARALPAAAALEFVHNFSLIHDDVQDGDVERRHKPTVWALWGQPQALVAGNAMRSLADITALGLTQRGLSEERALRASFLLTRGYLDMTKGQCLDLAFEGSMEIRLEDYLTMVSCKTGALIRCGMEMGALIGSDDETTIRAIASCGAYLGLAFQIRDDVLGIWGEEGSTGKAVGNDIRRKKKSFPVVYALEVAGAAARRQMVDTYSKLELNDRDVQDVLLILEELNVAEHAQDMVREQADLALHEVQRVALPSWAEGEMQDLVEFLAQRQY